MTHLETKAFGSERFGPPLASNGQARLVRRDLARLAVSREVRRDRAARSREPCERCAEMERDAPALFLT